MEKIRMTADEWNAKGIELFGDDQMQWRFRCPSCGHEASVNDYKEAGAPSSVVGFSCVGRWLPTCRDAFGSKGGGPCNYAGGGLIGINPLIVTTADGTEVRMFEFGSPVQAATPEPAAAVGGR